MEQLQELNGAIYKKETEMKNKESPESQCLPTLDFPPFSVTFIGEESSPNEKEETQQRNREKKRSYPQRYKIAYRMGQSPATTWLSYKKMKKQQRNT